MRLRTFLGGVAVLLMATSPASGKGPMVVEASIVGPGLSRPLVLRDHFEQDLGAARLQDAMRFRRLAEGSHVYDAIYSRSGVTTREPRGELGPRFTITWMLAFVNGPDGSIERLGTMTTHLFPYAEGGPVSYSPAQRTRVMQIDAGWQHAPDVLVEHLRAWGLPAGDRIVRPAPFEPVEDRVSSHAPWLLAVVVAAATLASAFAARAFRRDPAV